MRKVAALFVAAALLLAAGCATRTATTAPAKPKLVVLLVVDGVPQRQVVDYRDQLAPDGLARLLDRGAWFANGHYGHAFTVTAAGHATMLTGAHPDRTGVIGNNWRNPATGEMEYCTGDAANTYLGHKTGALDGTSPKNLKVETVGDVLKRSSPQSKVIAISEKDRSAILLAGKTGTAYMYMWQTGQYASTTYYMRDHPKWVKDYNAAKPADAYFHRQWKPLLDEGAYARSLPDEQKWYAKGGKLPKTMGEGQDRPGPLFYGELTPSPFGDRMLLDFARAAIAGEKLGQREAPDILALSLSGHDYINHAYSAESRLSHDHLLQLDRLLQSFFADLDATIGKGNYLVALTADHGFMPAPEHSLSLGRDAGRQNIGQTTAKLNAALAAKFGPGRWAVSNAAMGWVLNRELAARSGTTLAAVEEEARKVLLEDPAIAVAYTREELDSGSRRGEPSFAAMQKSFDRERSGDIQVALKPYWIFSSSTIGTTHGSPYPYDTNVPILLYGPAWVKAGRYDERVEVVDIAPTLARVLGVAPPSASEGKVLPALAVR